MRFEVATAKDIAESEFDLVTMYDCLHDMGDPRGCAAHVRKILKKDGAWMIVEPDRGGQAGAEHESRGPHLLQRVNHDLCADITRPGGRRRVGCRSQQAKLSEIIGGAGFSKVRRAAEGPLHGPGGSVSVISNFRDREAICCSRSLNTGGICSRLPSSSYRSSTRNPSGLDTVASNSAPAGRPHVNRIKVSAVLAIRGVGEPQSFEAELDVALNVEILHFECAMVHDPLSICPNPPPVGLAPGESRQNTAASAGSNLVTDAIPVHAALLSAPSVLHELLGTFGIPQ